jgi:hypothetical protein
VLVSGGLASAAYLGIAWVLRVEELRWLMRMVREKVK